jgi:hypothetical protein
VNANRLESIYVPWQVAWNYDTLRAKSLREVWIENDKSRTWVVILHVEDR